MRLTAFTKYDRSAASTRQRLLQYVPALEAAGVEVDYRPLLGDDYVASLAGRARFTRRSIARSYFRRLREISFGNLGDVVFVYAELLPRLPALVDRLLFLRCRPIVYDFDDAFFHAYDQHPSAFVRTIFARKFEPLLRSAAACTCGNAYLRDYAAQYCDNTVTIPTVVDTELYRPGEHEGEGPPVIGWIGSPSTWAYVLPLLPMLERLVIQRRARLRVIGAGSSAASQELSWIEFVDWSEGTEISELQQIDIGIMPLPDEPWTRGKSGFKLIQYMACGLPVIASPVGVNCEIVNEGVNGLLAGTDVEWRSALDVLLSDSGLRAKFGSQGRCRATAEYSLTVQAPRFVRVIREAARRDQPQFTSR